MSDHCEDVCYVCMRNAVAEGRAEDRARIIALLDRRMGETSNPSRASELQELLNLLRAEHVGGEEKRDG